MNARRNRLLRRNILKILAEADGLLLLDEYLQTDVDILTPTMRATEYKDAIRAAEDDGLITSVSSEFGVKYKINDQGQAWRSEDRAS